MLKNMRSATSNLSHENQAGQDRSLSKAFADQQVQQQLQCQRAEHHPIEVSDTNRVRHVLGDRKGYFQSPGHEVLLRLRPCSYAGTHTITAHFKEATVAHLIVACHLMQQLLAMQHWLHSTWPHAFKYMAQHCSNSRGLPAILEAQQMSRGSPHQPVHHISGTRIMCAVQKWCICTLQATKPACNNLRN